MANPGSLREGADSTSRCPRPGFLPSRALTSGAGPTQRDKFSPEPWSSRGPPSPEGDKVAPQPRSAGPCSQATVGLQKGGGNAQGRELGPWAMQGPRLFPSLVSVFGK